jgi:hypothetical protein
MVNKLTGFSSFQLQMGCNPHVLPPLISSVRTIDPSKLSAAKVTERIHVDIMEAKDNLTHAKISQATQSNKSCLLTFPFKVGDCVWLSTLHQHHEFKFKGQQ